MRSSGEQDAALAVGAERQLKQLELLESTCAQHAASFRAELFAVRPELHSEREQCGTLRAEAYAHKAQVYAHKAAASNKGPPPRRRRCERLAR